MWQFDLVRLASDRYTQWDAWVMSRPEGCVFNTTHWLRAMSGVEPTVVAALGDYNRIIGGFAFVEMEDTAGLKRILAPAYTPYFAPIIPEPTDEEIEAGFLKELHAFLSPYDGMRWRPFSAARQDLLAESSVEHRESPTMLLSTTTPSFDQLVAGFSRSHRSKINKALKIPLKAHFSIQVADIYPFVEQSMQANDRAVPISRLRFIDAFESLLELELVFCIGVKSPEGKLLAAGIYAQDLQRVYNLVIGTPRQEQYPEAGVYLHYLALQKAYQLRKDFDFEGSSLPGVKEFYARFHPEVLSLKSYSFTRSVRGRLAAPLFKVLGKNLY